MTIRPCLQARQWHFGTTAPDVHAVAGGAIRRSRQRCSGLLEAIGESGEIWLDVAYEHEADPRTMPAEDPSPATRSERLDREGADLVAKVSFGKEVAERFRMYCRDQASHVFAPADEFADEGVRLSPPRAVVERIALLIRLDRIERLDAYIAGVRESSGLADVTSTGPLPVFSFLEWFAENLENAGLWSESRCGG